MLGDSKTTFCLTRQKSGKKELQPDLVDKIQYEHNQSHPCVERKKWLSNKS